MLEIRFAAVNMTMIRWYRGKRGRSPNVAFHVGEPERLFVKDSITTPEDIEPVMELDDF